MDKSIFKAILILLSISISYASSYVISGSNQDSSQSVNSITSNVPSSVPPIKNTIKNSTNNAENNNNLANADEASQQQESEQYWLRKRELFFNQTTFSLTKKTNEFCGEEYGNRSYHLPFWFDYEMFKNLTDRVNTDPDVELKRHHIFMDNCIFIWKNTAFKRLHRPNNFTFIDHAEDWVSLKLFL